jgi:DNA-binding XRE family transcriptional regulator
MKPPSPKADQLRQMRERQHEERERKAKPVNVSRETLVKAVRAVAAKPKRHK